MKYQIKEIFSYILDFFIGLFYKLEPSVNSKVQYKKNIFRHYKYKKIKKNIIKGEKNNFDLSIIIPVYNAENYIDICLKSIINQKTNYKYEILAIDDGSTDKSLEILKKYKDKVKIFHTENNGVASARNFGLTLAGGNYISFIDIDDYIDKSFVEKLLNEASKTHADIIKCNYYKFENNKIIYQSKNKKFNTKNVYDSRVSKSEGFIWNGIYKREIWEAINFPNDYYYEDMILKLVILNKIKSFSRIEDCLYYYRKSKKSLSRNKKNYKNYNCIDQLFLPNELIDLYNIQINESNQCNYLFEYSAMLYFRTRNLNKSIKKDIFIYATSIVKYEKIQYEKLNEDYKYLFKSLFQKKYLMWKLVSLKLYLFS